MGVTVREKVKGSGVYWVFINHNNQRRSKKIGTKAAANKVKKKLELKHAMDKIGFGNKKTPTLYKYGKEWVETFVAARRAQTTYTRYIGLVEQRIKPALGNRQLNDITRGDIKRFLLSEFEEGYAPSSIGLLLNVLSGIFTAALDDEYIQVNPCSTLTKGLDINRSKKKDEIDPLTKEETESALESIKLHYPEYYVFFFTAFRTAARIGELCALRWSDINYSAGTIKICRTAKDQTVKDSTKTHLIRRIELSDQLLSMLVQYKKEDNKICLAQKIPQNYIFHKGSSLFAQNTIRRYWHSALKKAGIDRRKFHDIRHTTASTLLARGVPVTAVSYLLGHSSPKITLDTYAHFMPSEHKGYTNLLDSENEVEYISDSR